MKVLITLDYELFLGTRTGRVEPCLIKPMDLIMSNTRAYGARFTLFVDAVYLFRLRELSHIYPDLAQERAIIIDHIQSLVNNGHDIQLHIHPSWFKATYDGELWKLDESRYKLSDLHPAEIEKIFLSAKAELDEIVGYRTIAFRAGGFSAQPTALLSDLFGKAGIEIDSSVCPGMRYNTKQQSYDYTSCPLNDHWRFTEDICVSDPYGQYIEIPITTYLVSPIIYWRLIVNRLLRSPKHKHFGDGCAIKASSGSIFRRLSRRTAYMATIDGYKITNLMSIYNDSRRKNRAYFTIIGHPKLATPYSVEKLADFCKYVIECGDEFATIKDCK